MVVTNVGKEVMTTLEQDYQEYEDAGRIWGLVPQERIKQIKFERVSKDVIDRYLAIEDLTTSVSDVLDGLGIHGMVPASYLRPLTTGRKVVGPAVTIRNIVERKTPTQGYVDKETIKMSTRDIYYLSEPGDVLVTDTGGNLDVSNMGGQSCTVAQTKGLAGSIVWGAVRDAGSIRRIDYPVWSAGITPVTGKFRIEAVEMNGPIMIHDVRVQPGDLMIADDSGVGVVPFQHIEYVIDQVEKIARDEEHMAQLIRDDVPISELRPHFRKRYS